MKAQAVKLKENEATIEKGVVKEQQLDQVQYISELTANLESLENFRKRPCY